jgi:hypothetical protein
MKRAKTHPFVGQWFHSYHADRTYPMNLNWQGKVLAEVSPGQFRVQLFEWCAGMPSNQVTVPLPDMASWTFYASHQQMLVASDTYAFRQRQAFEAEHGDGVHPPQRH